MSIWKGYLLITFEKEAKGLKLIDTLYEAV